MIDGPHYKIRVFVTEIIYCTFYETPQLFFVPYIFHTLSLHLGDVVRSVHAAITLFGVVGGI